MSGDTVMIVYAKNHFFRTEVFSPTSTLEGVQRTDTILENIPYEFGIKKLGILTYLDFVTSKLRVFEYWEKYTN